MEASEGSEAGDIARGEVSQLINIAVWGSGAVREERRQVR